MFPGQGSQQPGMGKGLYEGHPAAREVFDTVTKTLGFDVANLCFESDEETLRQTENAQVALFTCGVAAWSALKAELPDLEPGVFAGHSVGEYAALAAAGHLTLEQGARLVRKRGELMARAGKLRPGAMAAVLGMCTEDIIETCKAVSDQGVCVIANDNCPGQVVVSGDVDAVHAFSAMAMERGAKRVLPLNVSGAFHSPLMEDSAEAMGLALAQEEFGDGKPVCSNVTAQPETSGWADLLEQQLRSPVRWTESVQRMIADGADTFVELGSGEVLCGLLRRIDKNQKAVRVLDMPTLEQTKEALA